MLIRIDDWNLVREQFSEAEKAVLNSAICGETICPRGIIISEAKAGEVAAKVKRLAEGLGTRLEEEFKRGRGRLRL
jgi:hypothetical protein